MTSHRGKPSKGIKLVSGFKEAANWGEPGPRQPRIEAPLPDYAPFAVPSDEVWRELQRRRNLVRMVETLAQSARDEGFPLSSQILGETAGKLREALILAGPSPVTPKPKRSSHGKDKRTSEQPATRPRAFSQQRNGREAGLERLAPQAKPDEVLGSAASKTAADALAALEQFASMVRKDAKPATDPTAK